MSFMMKIAMDTIRGQLYKALLARLSESDIRQRDAAPVIFEKLERYAEPYLKAVPRAMNYMAAKCAFSFVSFVSFFAFFAEVLRQIDQAGRILPSAYLAGFLSLFLCSLGGFFLVRPPTLERFIITPSVTPTVGAVYPPGEEPAKMPREYTNVEQLRQPAATSGIDFLLDELRAERASFFSRHG